MKELGAEQLERISEWLRRHSAEIAADIVSFAELETPSTSLEHLRVGAAHLIALTRLRLGEPESLRVITHQKHGDTYVIDWVGTGGRRVTCHAHYDTVWPIGTLAEWPIVNDGATISGPGVFDMKAGCIQLIWAVCALREQGIATPPIRFVFNGDEEIGSPASRPVIEAAVEGAALAMIFEPSDDGALKVGRKGIGWAKLHLTGVSAHAGLDYWSGVSAIDEMARLIPKIHAISDRMTGLTLNVGTIRGGTNANVVAESAEALVDIRVARAHDVEHVERRLLELRPHSNRADLKVSIRWNRPPMETGPLTLEPFALARATASAIGLSLEHVEVGGASDGNFIAALGVPTLDGLGAIGAGAHARTERTKISETVLRTAIAAGVVAAYANTW